MLTFKIFRYEVTFDATKISTLKNHKIRNKCLSLCRCEREHLPVNISSP